MTSQPLSTPAVAMTIAGSDPSGGAGLQADLKTFAGCGVHGVSVITAVIAQNSARVGRLAAVAPAMVRAQIEMLASEGRPAALKTGALINAGIARTVAAAIAEWHLPAPVIDPVLLSSSGTRLIDRAGETVLRSDLIPLARVITPNLPEAETLTGVVIDSPSALREAARILQRMGAAAVVIKGGHALDGNALAAAFATDLFFDGRRFIELTAPRIPGEGAHGTGCAFASAIAAWLARGAGLERAVREAKRFVSGALARSYRLHGGGRPLLGHLPAKLRLSEENCNGGTVGETGSIRSRRRRPT
jgi:hydroxymethylpyrimidine kinase/phosphomethylpyrimidine kinase